MVATATSFYQSIFHSYCKVNWFHLAFHINLSTVLQVNVICKVPVLMSGGTKQNRAGCAQIKLVCSGEYFQSNDEVSVILT